MTAAGALTLLLFLAAAVFRLRGLSWDEGMMFHPDERNLATAAARLSWPDGLVPDFHAYNGLALFLPRLLAEALASVGILGATGVPEIAWCARLLSAFLSLAAVFAIYRTARDLFDEETAALAAFLAAFSPGLVQAAHFGTTESGLVLVVSLLMLVSVRHVGTQIANPSAALLYGLILGFGLGLKTTAAAFALIPIFSFSLARTGTMVQRFGWLAAAGVLSVLVLLATTPQILLNPQAYLDTMIFEGGVVRGTVDVFWTYQFHGATNVLFELRQIPWLLDPVSAVFIVPGLIIVAWQAVRGGGRPRLLFPALAAGLIYFGLVSGWHAKFIRYLVPLLPLFIMAVACAWFATGRKWGLALRRPLTALIVFSMLIYGFMQAGLYLRRDSRISAWTFLLANMQKGDTLLVEPVEVGPPLGGAEKLSLRVAVLPLIEPSGPAKMETLAGVLASGDWMIIASRRHHRVLPHMRARFPEMCGYYDALWSGRLGYELLERFNRRAQGVVSVLDPVAIAEETFSVFDSPEVFIFRNARRARMEDIRRELGNVPPGCR